MVTMSHVDLAVTEMFRAVHMQLLGNTCRLEKLVLAALVIETRATGTSPCSNLSKIIKQLHNTFLSRTDMMCCLCSDWHGCYTDRHSTPSENYNPNILEKAAS